jgi:hypothetical protein
MKREKPTALLRIEPQRADGDCCLASLATLLGLPYETVLAEAVRYRTRKKHGLRGKYPHHTGMFFTELITIAKRLGYPMRKKRRCDTVKDKGILSVLINKGSLGAEHHAVVLMAGLIFDLDERMVWLPKPYLRAHRAKLESILVPV